MCVLLVVGDCVGARKKGNHQHKDWSHPSYEYIIPFSEHTHTTYISYMKTAVLLQNMNNRFLIIAFRVFVLPFFMPCM